MAGFSSKELMTLSLCSAFILVTPALAQPAGPEDATASEQSSQASSTSLGQGTKAQAEHSAEATAHKSVGDPNNQLGTSLQGRTRPVAGADVASQNTASTERPAASDQ